MFFLHNLERRVTLHPSYFGRNMHELVTTKLLKDVEGTCTGNYYIIAIMDTFDVSEGRILPGSGMSEFTVGYRAVVWRPFKGEVVRYNFPPPPLPSVRPRDKRRSWAEKRTTCGQIDSIVVSINPHGFFAQAGPLRLFVSSHVRGGK